MKKWACFALVFCLCLALAGCGGASPADTDTANLGEAPEPDHDLKVEDCYTFTENADGTYSYEVAWRGGGILYAEQNIDRPVSFTAADEDLLIIEGQAGTGVGARWAMFCDIECGRTSDHYGGYLAAVGRRVAFVDMRTDAYHVFVCDPFEPNVHTQVVTLEGLVVDGDVIKDFAMSEESVLSVTYATADGSKTVAIDLLADQSK